MGVATRAKAALKVGMSKVIANLLIFTISKVFAENCCRQQLVKGANTLDGLYTLIEERSLEDLPPQDRAICQSGCVYTRSGSLPHEEYCFAESSNADATSCSAFGEAESLILEKKGLVEEMDTLNRSYLLGLNDLETRREALNEAEAAKEVVLLLLTASNTPNRARSDSLATGRSQVPCDSTLVWVTSLVLALASSNTQEMQVFSSHITSSNLLPCSSDESQELSSKVEELAVEQEEENKALLELETRLVELVEAIRGLEEQIAAITAQLGDQVGWETTTQVDDSAEVPLILQGNEKLLFEQEEQDELPFPLPIQVIPSSEFFI